MHGSVGTSRSGLRGSASSISCTGNRGEDRLQLGHSGRKGSTQLGWEDIDHPLAAGNWPVLSASPIPYMDGVSQVPGKCRGRTWMR